MFEMDDRGLQAMFEGLLQLPSTLLPSAQPAIEADLDRSFGDGTDPYGTSWAPRKDTDHDDGHAVLADTGDLKRSLVVVSGPDGALEVSYTDPKAVYLQGGTDTTPARPVLPDDRGMPASWDAAIDEAFDDAVRRL